VSYIQKVTSHPSQKIISKGIFKTITNVMML